MQALKQRQRLNISPLLLRPLESIQRLLSSPRQPDQQQRLVAVLAVAALVDSLAHASTAPNEATESHDDQQRQQLQADLAQVIAQLNSGELQRWMDHLAQAQMSVGDESTVDARTEGVSDADIPTQDPMDHHAARVPVQAELPFEGEDTHQVEPRD